MQSDTQKDKFGDLEVENMIIQEKRYLRGFDNNLESENLNLNKNRIGSTALETQIDLSVVIPVYNEQENIIPLLNEIESVFRGQKISYEIIAVDDGSSDGSQEILQQEFHKRSCLKVIMFRKNFGQTAAFDAGFQCATGKTVVTMDADGQNDPADIPKMLEILDQGYDFVAGWRKNRKDSALNRNLPSKIANFLIRQITKTKLKDLGCSLKVYKKEIVDDLQLYGEMHRFIGVLAEGVGAKVTQIEVNHRPRMAGVSKYNISRTFKVLLDLITVWFLKSYQTKPIYVFGGAGLLMCFGSFLSMCLVLYYKITGGVWVHKNPIFLIGLILGVIGIQFIALGLIAEIMVRSYFESQNKRPFIVAKTLSKMES